MGNEYQRKTLMEHMKRVHDSDDITKAYLRMANIYFYPNGDSIYNKEKHILTCNFCCDICQKSFAQKQTLTRHIKTVHNQNKPTIKCDDCH